jgi:hypothetical protein
VGISDLEGEWLRRRRSIDLAESQPAPGMDRCIDTVQAVSAPTIAEAVEELDLLESDAMMQGVASLLAAFVHIIVLH